MDRKNIGGSLEDHTAAGAKLHSIKNQAKLNSKHSVLFLTFISNI